MGSSMENMHTDVGVERVQFNSFFILDRLTTRPDFMRDPRRGVDSLWSGCYGKIC